MNYVFVPGTLCDERVFKDQLPLFNPNTVIDVRHSETIEDMVNEIYKTQIFDMTLIGFSMGGCVALEFALKYPERVKNLVIIASSSEGYPEDEKKIVLDSLPLIEKGFFKGITTVRLKDYLHPISFENKPLRDLIQNMAGLDAKDVYLRQTHATLNRRNLNDQLHQLQMPTYFIGGEDDKIVSIKSIQRSANHNKKIKFISIEHCGHFVTLEQPLEINQILNTLNK